MSVDYSLTGPEALHAVEKGLAFDLLNELKVAPEQTAFDEF